MRFGGVKAGIDYDFQPGSTEKLFLTYESNQEIFMILRITSSCSGTRTT